MDDNVIKQAIDDFESDDFISAKEKLKGEIVKTRDDFLKKKLGLEGEINPTPELEPEPEPEPKKKGLFKKTEKKK